MLLKHISIFSRIPSRPIKRHYVFDDVDNEALR